MKADKINIQSLRSIMMQNRDDGGVSKRGKSKERMLRGEEMEVCYSSKNI
jgi:hypothetical protein